MLWPRRRLPGQADEPPPRFRDRMAGGSRQFPVEMFRVNWVLVMVDPPADAPKTRDPGEDAWVEGPFCPHCGTRLEEAGRRHLLAIWPQVRWTCPECRRDTFAWASGTKEARALVKERALSSVLKVLRQLKDL